MQGEEAIVKCGTTKGPIEMKFYRDWSPNGYDRATYLYEQGFFDGSHFFRAVPGFLCQFGITYSEDENLRKLMHQTIPDDPQLEPRIPFKAGTMSYAGSGPNSRSSQMFISYGAHQSLGTELWETPFGEVTSGMHDVAAHFYSYGDMPPWGKGPVQGKIYNGPEYINENFPLIDSFEKCTVQRIYKKDESGNHQAEQEADHQPATGDAEDHRELGLAANDAVHAAAAGLGGGSLASAKKRLQAAGAPSLQLAFSSVDGQYFLGGFIVVMIMGIIAATRSGRKVMHKTS